MTRLASKLREVLETLDRVADGQAPVRTAEAQVQEALGLLHTVREREGERSGERAGMVEQIEGALGDPARKDALILYLALELSYFKGRADALEGK